MTKRLGRPPAGDHGDKTSEWKQLAIRLPDATLARLRRWQMLDDRPLWRLVDDAIAFRVLHLPLNERKLIEAGLKRAMRKTDE
jgi:hypothetical protein